MSFIGKANLELSRKKKFHYFTMSYDRCLRIKIEMSFICFRLLEVGTKFCNSLSPNSASIATSSLQESLKKQCWAYFYSYHCDRLEDLKMHLENEVIIRFLYIRKS